MNSKIAVSLFNDNTWLLTLANQLEVEPSGNRLILPKNLGKGVLNEFRIEPGLTVSFGDMELSTELEIENLASRKKDSITIFFKYLERGHSFFKPFNADYKEVKSGGVQFSSSNVQNHLYFPANTHCFLFRVHLSMEWLSTNLSDFIGQHGDFREMIFGNNKIMHFEPLTNRFLRLFSDVFKSEFDQKLNHLIVKDKGYEAIVIFFDHFYKQFFTEDIKPSKYSISDQKRLYELVDFIKSNLHQELSLDQLSREVGFSKSKLQSMFHYFFHQSIYAFIKNLKFEKAVEMLVNTDKDIRQVAFSLGYNSSTHFINIFKRHFGISPKKFRKKKMMEEVEL